MHTLLALTGVLLVVLGGYGALCALRRLRGWSGRRDLQFLVLAAPLLGLGVGIAALHHFADRTCFLGAPPWDYALGIALPLGMGAVALVGLLLGLLRLALMVRAVAGGALAGGELAQQVGEIAERLGVAPPRVRVRACDRPLALTAGLRRPTVLLSTWMLEHLDGRELEAVLAHELGHVARRDYPVVWLATILRDAFFYLPTSWAAYRQLQAEKELACDDLAVAATRRPLALASALAKVWHRSLSAPALAAGQPLVGAGATLEERIERLLASPAAPQPARSRAFALAVGASALGVLLVLEALNAVVMAAPMDCRLTTPLGLLLG